MRTKQVSRKTMMRLGAKKRGLALAMPMLGGHKKRGRPGRADVVELIAARVASMTAAIADAQLYEAAGHARAIRTMLDALMLPADRRNGTPDRRGGR